MDEETKENLEEIIKASRLPDEAKEDLERNVESYKRLISKMARKYVRNRVEYDDLVQEAFFGLMLACRDFNPDRSNDFHTYAIYRMKGKMYEYCIGNENPIYVPTHVAKAASYVKQMYRLLEKEADIAHEDDLIAAIISVKKHDYEANLSSDINFDLSELKRKLGNIANNSSMKYEGLASLAMESLSMVVSDEVLSKYPKETDLVEDLVSNREMSRQLENFLGERRFTVLSMKSSGWTLEEIAERLAELGYTNRQGKRITRQAVKAILDEAKKTVLKTKKFRSWRI